MTSPRRSVRAPPSRRDARRGPRPRLRRHRRRAGRRPRRHRRRGGARRRLPRTVGAGRRRPRPRLRHLPLELQAGARRAALPRQGSGRGGARERRGARDPHDPHRSPPHPRDAHGGAADRRRPPPPGRCWPCRASAPATPCAPPPAPPAACCPGPRRLSAGATRALVPPVRTHGLRGGLLSHDGQLEDDARLVVAIARTAAAYGARVVTHARALDVSADGATIRDELTGRTTCVRRALGGQRRRRVGRAGRRRPHPASQPRHPPGAARRAPGRASTSPSPPPCRAR